MSKEKTISEYLSGIQQELLVGKGQRNDFSHYDYRNAEDILKAVKPLLGSCTLVIDTNMVMVADRVYVEAIAILANNGNQISAKAYAREAASRKGMDDSQLTGATASYAKKYALGNLFALDNEADADSMDNRKKGAKPKEKPKPVDYTDSIQAINECGSMDELGVLWGELSATARKALEQVKNEAKARLAA